MAEPILKFIWLIFCFALVIGAPGAGWAEDLDAASVEDSELESRLALVRQTAGEKSLNLEAAVRLGLEHSPLLRALHQDVSIRKLEYETAYSAFLPQLQVNSDLTAQNSATSPSGNRLTGQWRLELSETIYDNGVSLNRYAASQLETRIAELLYRYEQDKLILAVATQFIQYSQAESLVEQRQEQMNLVQKQSQVVTSQYRQGLRARQDYLRFRAELQRQEVDVERAVLEAETARLAVMQSLGVARDPSWEKVRLEPLTVDLKFVADLPKEVVPVEQHPLFRIAELRQKVWEKEVDLARRRQWFEIGALMGAYFSQTDPFGTDPAMVRSDGLGWSAQVTLTIPLWDWGRRRRDLEIADAKRTQKDLRQADELNVLKVDHSRMLLELRQSLRNFTLARELVELEMKGHALLENEFRLGKASQIDLIVGSRDLLNARVNMTNSYFELRQKLYRLYYFQGQIRDVVMGEATQ